MRKRVLLNLCLLPFIVVLTSCGGGGTKTTPPVTAKADLNPKSFSKFAEVTNQFIETSLLSFHQIAIASYGYSIPVFSTQNDTVTLSCNISGTKKKTISLNGAKTVFTYTSCNENNSVLNGTYGYEFLNINRSKESYTFLLTFNNMTVTTGGYKEVTTGSFKTDFQMNSISGLSLKSTINQKIEYINKGEVFEAKNVIFSGVEIIEDISGNIEIKSLDSISLHSDKANHRITLKGSDDSDIGYMKYLGNLYYERGFISSDQSVEPTGTVLNRHQILTPDILLSNVNSAPEISPIQNKQTDQSIPLALNFISQVSDINHDALSFDLKVSGATPDSYSLTKNSFSEYVFQSNIPNSYNMELTVTDPYGSSATQLFSINVINNDIDGDGIPNDQDDDDDDDGILDVNDAFPLDGNESVDTDGDGIGNNADPDDDNDGTNDELDAFPLNPNESLDTDSDGIGNNSDRDNDNDGIPDTSDAFPLDASESVDSDGDGIGNNADTDDDNDGVNDVLDTFPLDPLCSSHENSEVCYLKNATTSSQIVTDAQGIVYFSIIDEKLLYRWDSATQSFLVPISLGAITSSDHTVTKMAYSKSHNRLYIGYDSGVISYIDISTGVEQSFHTLPKKISNLTALGNFILAQAGSSTREVHYIFDKDSNLADKSSEWNYYSIFKWNPKNNRIYFFSDNVSPNDIFFEEINPTTGKILNNGESPYHGDYVIKPPIIINETGNLIVIGSGSIFNTTDLTWAGAVPGEISDGIWIDSIGFVALRDSNGSTALERRDNSSLQVIEDIIIDGTPLKIVSTANGYFILSKYNNSLLITPYTPNNDTDGDGSLNTDDSFPLDRAASVDSDNDGYPDYWNTGMTVSDSTTGLTLDSYPQDSACYLPEHGDGVICDVSSTLPNYTPDKTIMGANGIIYLFSKENNKIFRWSIPLNDDLSPIIIGTNGTFNTTSPNIITYSENLNRLYLGYDSGKITYIPLNSSQLKEQDFTVVAQSVKGLASMEDFLLVQDYSGAWATHYFYNKEGILTDSNDWNYYSTVYAWNASLNRIYFFNGNSSPVHYEEIDLLTGKRVSKGESSYLGNYSIKPPMLFSPDESQLLIGSGNIFTSDTLSWNSTVANAFDMGIWANNGDIITLRNISGTTRLDHYNSSKTWIHEQDYTGIPVGSFEYQSKYYIVTKNLEHIVVTEYIPQ